MGYRDGHLRMARALAETRWRQTMDAVSHSGTEVSTGDDLAVLEAASSNTSAPDRLQFWEAQHTRPAFQTGDQESPELVAAAENYLGTCMAHPYLPVSQIRDQQFARIKQLVEMAYREIPVYRAKYKAAGFKPSHLRNYDDIQKIPVITKPELVAPFPDQCVNKKDTSESLVQTR